MIKKFSFWVVLAVMVLIGSIVVVHRSSLQQMYQKASRMQPLYQRQKELNLLSLTLERYRQASSVFRKQSPEEITRIKDKLKTTFEAGVERLSQLEPSPEEREDGQRLNAGVAELLEVVDRIEPTLFTKDAYVKPEVQSLHEKLLALLGRLERANDTRVSSLHLSSFRENADSIIFLLGMGGAICLLILALILRNHLVYIKPLKRLYLYASKIKAGEPLNENPPRFSGMYAEIQRSLGRLASSVETHIRDRHKFILDIVTDLKAPLTLLQSGKYLLEQSNDPSQEVNALRASESVRRGLALFAGSLEDLDDIVDINRLESRLEETTVDLTDLLSDVSRTVLGPDLNGKVSLSVPPIPVWMMVDRRRIERMLIQLFSKVLSTLPKEGCLSVSLSQTTQAGMRGVEIVIQDIQRLKGGRGIQSGPEQDMMKHWISESGVSMTLAHKIVRAHGGSLTASGVAGMSVSIMIRLPQERVVTQGLIAPPTRGLLVKSEKIKVTNSNSSAG